MSRGVATEETLAQPETCVNNYHKKNDIDRTWHFVHIRHMDMLNTAEAAKLLGISAQTLRSWRSGEKKKGPAFCRLDGHRIRYRRDDIETWIANRVERIDPQSGSEAPE